MRVAGNSGCEAAIGAGSGEGGLPAGFGLNELWALASILIIDLVLAGDNAIVVGLAAAGLQPAQRRNAIIWGIVAATLLRIGFAAVALNLLAIVGLTLAGGILLLWVAWKLFRELHAKRTAPGASNAAPPPRKTFLQAWFQIVFADVSMSLDNVLAVAGAARENIVILVIGLVLSVALMGVASHMIVRLLQRWPWISWVGLAIIALVALRMIYDGSMEVVTETGLH